MAEQSKPQQRLNGFKPGKSGNPGGKPKQEPLPSREEILRRLWRMARTPKQGSMLVVAACRVLLDEIPRGAVTTPAEATAADAELDRYGTTDTKPVTQ